MNKIVVVNFNK